MATETREPSTKTDLQVDLADPMADWYDRSSLVGEFMVAIEGQSVEDYLRRAPENRFCEYIDGVVYMPSPATLWHQFDVQLLTTLLDMFIGARRLGHLLTGPACLRISPTRYLEPDIFVVPLRPRGRSLRGSWSILRFSSWSKSSRNRPGRTTSSARPSFTERRAWANSGSSMIAAKS